MAPQNCKHGLEAIDERGVCSDCAGHTRVTGAVFKDTDGRHRVGRFVALRGRAKAGTCRRCGEPSTTKDTVSDILQPWCDGSRREAVQALRDAGAVGLKNLDGAIPTANVMEWTPAWITSGLTVALRTFP